MSARKKKAQTKRRTSPDDEADRQEAGPYPEQRTHVLSDLEQVKALADPLRIRLLEGFCRERTTKQVADLMGERPTRLYHHVDALEKVGLIRLTRTRPNRGTMEKYYLAVARSFQADTDMFSSGSEGREEGGEAMESVVSGIFDRTKGEVLGLMDSEDLEKIIEEEGILGQVEIHAPEAFVLRFKKRLHRLLTDLQKECDRDEAHAAGPGAAGKGEKGESPERRFRLTLAYFPLDRSPRG